MFPGIIRAYLGESAPVADTSSLEDLPIEQLSKEFLATGVSECRELLSQFAASRTFAPDLDFVSIRKSLHRWAGVGGTLGVPEITRKAREMEALLETFDPSQRGDLRQKLVELLDQFLHAVPVIQPPAAAPRKEVIPAAGSARVRPVVLVGDDDAMIRTVIKQMLESAGFECRMAADGIGVLTMALSEPPAAIILDLNMPRMNGFRVLDFLRDQWSTCKVPVILLTASNEESDIRRGVKMGAASYMIKPFKTNDLLARLEQVIAARKP
jgi:CheY-like chemotaxis protein